MTVNQWFEKWNGKKIEWDDVSYYQCVDAIKCYVQEVYKIKTKGKGTSAWGNAINYFDSFNVSSWGGYYPFHKVGFQRFKNTRLFVPMLGDIGIFRSGLYGHVCICTGEGNISRFKSYDQNWNGQFLHEVIHNYEDFAGVLRPPRWVQADVNVRNAPDIKGKKIGELSAGTRVMPLCYSGEWVKIKDDAFIHRNFLYPTGSPPKWIKDEL